MEEKKVWERPWSPEEIIQNSKNWSLAGDAGILNYLEEFSEDLFNKVESINENINLLTENLKQVQLSLDIVNNEFMSLHNTQFIESRVYEEDETEGAIGEIQTGNVFDHSQNGDQIAEDNISLDKGSTNNVEEEERIADMKEAIMIGLDVVNKYYEKIDVAVDSDSEDDEAPKEILRPKDIYSDRPLPYIIGTEEWYKKWHVGLLDSSSEDEAIQEREQFSDDEDIKKAKNFMSPEQAIHNITGDSSESYSDAENELLRNQSKRRPVANSTFNDTISKRDDLFGSDSEEDVNIVPNAQVPSSVSNFAEQLAAKLGNVINQPVVNKRPIGKTEYHGNLIPDSPPPLDDDIEHNDGNQGLFASDNVVRFVDDLPIKSDNLFKIPDTIESGHIQSSTQKIDQSKYKPRNISSGGLFNDEEDDEDFDTLFKPPNISTSASAYLKPSSKTNVPLFSEQPPDLEPPAVKKPVEKAPVIPELPKETFVTKTPGSIKKQPSSSDFRPKSPEVENISNATGKLNSNNSKKKSSVLFEDDDDDLFASGPSGKFSTSLFDSEPPLDSESLFGNISTNVPTPASNTNQNAISKDVNPTLSSTIKKEIKKESLFEDPEDLFKAIKRNKPEISLFDEPDEDDFDDLFAPKTMKTDIKPKSNNKIEQKIKNDDIFNKSFEKTQTKLKTNLFDDDSPLDKEVEDIFGDGPSNKESKSSDVIISAEPAVAEIFKKSSSSESSNIETKMPSNLSKTKLSLFDDDETPSDREEDLFKTVKSEREQNLFKTVKSEREEDLFKAVKPNESSSASIKSKLESNTPSSTKDSTTNYTKSKTVNFLDDLSSNAEDALFTDNKSNSSTPSKLKTDSSDDKFVHNADIKPDHNTKRDESESVNNIESMSSSERSIESKIETVNTATKELLENTIETMQMPSNLHLDEKSENTVPEVLEQVSSVAEDVTGGQTISSLFNSGHNTIDRSESGIVKDNVTFQSDSSQSTSFLSPIASSSRRYSTTDQTFHEQQRDDSLFITKSQLDIPPPILECPSPSNSGVESVLEITPSGNPSDVFLSTDGTSSTLGDVFESETASRKGDNVSSAKTKLSSLFSDSEEDDLFGETPKKRSGNLLFGSDDEDLFSGKSSGLLANKVSKSSRDIVTKQPVSSSNSGALNKENDTKPDNSHTIDRDNVDTAILTPGRVDKLAKSSGVDEIFDATSYKVTDKPKVVGKLEEADVKNNLTEEIYEEMDENRKDGGNSGENEVQLRPKVTSPGRLRPPSFNINVAALLPGAGPPKRRPPTIEASSTVESSNPVSLRRCVSSEEQSSSLSQKQKEQPDALPTKSLSVSQMRNSLNINVGALLPPTPEIAAIQKDVESIVEPPVSFESPDDNVETLKSVTKDRARVVKRRPSSRKGRQEMIRKSGIDFQEENIIPDDPSESTVKQEHLQSPSTEDEDLFNISSNSQKSKIGVLKSHDWEDDLFSTSDKKVQHEQHSTPQDKKGDSEDRSQYGHGFDPLFQNPQNSKLLEKTKQGVEEDLFSAAQNPTKKPSTSFSMVFDDDDDDDIFSTKKMPVPQQRNVQPRNKSLFGDTEDDDDLFGNSSATATTIGTSSATKKTSKSTVPTGQLRKISDSEIMEDPLDALRK